MAARFAALDAAGGGQCNNATETSLYTILSLCLRHLLRSQFMFVSEDLNQPQGLANVVCGGIMVVSSLSQALFWQDKAQARRG